MRVDRISRAAIAAILVLMPLYPAFITLTGVSAPGVSLLSRNATIVLFAFVVLCEAIAMIAVLRPPRTWPPTARPLAAWFCAALISAVFGFDPAAGLLFLAIFGMNILYHCAISRFADERFARVLYGALCASAALASLTAIVTAQLRKPAQLYAIAHGRAVGSFVLPGELAGYLIVVLPLALEIVLSRRTTPLRVCAGAALLFGLPAFILTFSRAGWIGLAAAFALYAAWRWRLDKRYGALILLLGFGSVLALFNVHHNPAENFTRISIWQAAIEMIRRFPLTGAGPFDFARIYALVRMPGGDPQAFHAHDIVLTMFAETGMLGVAAMLWSWWVFARALSGRLARNPIDGPAAAAIAAGLAGTWVQGLIDTVSVVIFGLWLPAMALALAAAAPRKEQE